MFLFLAWLQGVSKSTRTRKAAKGLHQIQKPTYDTVYPSLLWAPFRKEVSGEGLAVRNKGYFHDPCAGILLDPIPLKPPRWLAP